MSQWLGQPQTRLSSSIVSLVGASTDPGQANLQFLLSRRQTRGVLDESLLRQTCLLLQFYQSSAVSRQRAKRARNPLTPPFLFFSGVPSCFRLAFFWPSFGLFSVLFFGYFYGIFGLFLAIPVAACSWFLFTVDPYQSRHRLWFRLR
jgi:hypothetical protein